MTRRECSAQEGKSQMISSQEQLNAFEAFCQTEAAEQRGAGFDVPTSAENAYAWYQWRAAARRVYELRNSSESTNTGGALAKRARAGSAPAENRTRGEGDDDPLAAAIAACVEDTLENGAESSSTMGPSIVEHAKKAAFPKPLAGVAGMREFLSVVEVMMRMALGGVKSRALGASIAGLRTLVNELRNREVVQFRPGAFPAVFVLLDLSSLDVVLERWAKLSPTTRRTALNAAIAICDQVKSDAARACVAALIAKRDGDLEGCDTAELRRKVVDTASSVPCDFPEDCDEVLPKVLPQYQAPTGVLEFAVAAAPRGSSPASVAPNAEDDISNSSAEELSVGDILRGKQPPKQQQSQPHLRQVQWHRLAPIPRPTAAPRRSGVGDSRHPQCVSQYHSRFAEASKHASSECCFCATCHLMEILFNSCRIDCTWGHWPTDRKIACHLRKFPQLRNVALDRFYRMGRGEILPPYTGPM